MSNKVYVIGGSQTDFERNWTREGKEIVALLKEVTNDAISETDIDYEELSRLNKNNRVACFMGNFTCDLFLGQANPSPLMTEVHRAFYGMPCARYETACASGATAIDAAVSKIRAGDIDLALVVGWEIMKPKDAVFASDVLARCSYYEKEKKFLPHLLAGFFGQLGDEYILRYGLDEAKYMNDLARLSAMGYTNAKRNPKAQTRKWFMSEAQAQARGTKNNPSFGRLSATDCSQITDGAVVLFLASEEYLKQRGFDRKVYVKGWGHRVAPITFAEKINEGRTGEYVLPWMRQAVLDAYRKAGITVEDVDVFETHDGFTSVEYASISAFGLTKPGREYEAIDDGRIFFNGTKPFNPSGGLIGAGHPVGATGVRMMLDLYKQLTCQAGSYQVANRPLRNGAMLNLGGSATTNYAFVLGI